ncbi:MAG: butyrate kinase [Desulfovibrionaceae bacterium]|jgi:butyrate kinase|nr:butyrate kinase [Desulfovibrionaceae bacterium]
MTERSHTILAVNPGSTTTKIAVFTDEEELFRATIEHDVRELGRFRTIAEQLPLRKRNIEQRLEEMDMPLSALDAVAGRGGGGLPPVRKGAYRVDERMVDQLVHRNFSEHASNLGALIAHAFGAELGVPAYIYDCVAVDELTDIARLSGLPELDRVARCHVLNMRAVALEVAARRNARLEDMNVVVTHMGGGVTSSVISRGDLVDIVADDEGSYSPERAGRVQCRKLIDMCFSGKYDRFSATRRVKGEGGFMAYLGTASALEVERRIAAGDERARLVYEGMAYQVSKDIGELATVVKGEVDAIILTGAVAHSAMMTGWIAERVSFIAPVEIVPGENELKALARGALRVLRGEEQAHEFTEG